MVNPRITTSENNSFNKTTDSHINKCLGTIDEDGSYGWLSSEFEDDQASKRCKFVTNPGTNISANRKYSRLTTPISIQPQVWCT
jgi:hypothetical protein